LDKAPEAFRTISEVADELDLPQHVLRFWETRFRDIKPMKRGGGRRYYRPDDIDLLRGIRHLLYGEGYTIRGVQRILREQGTAFVQAVWTEGTAQPPHGAAEDEAEETESLEQEGGLRGKLASFIGRDLGERGDGAAERSDPPLQSAPMPRIDAEDRALHVRAEPTTDDLEFDDEDEPPPSEAMPAAAKAPVSNMANERDELSRDDLRKLHAALHELAECRKLIDSAVARPAGA
jgi:DNA-binding transcriptional MerR regulator